MIGYGNMVYIRMKGDTRKPGCFWFKGSFAVPSPLQEHGGGGRDKEGQKMMGA